MYCIFRNLISNMSQKTVNILLSTYNGEKFVLEQLNSIYEQTYPFIKIYVRDDGSSDSTLNLLKNEQSQGKITLLPSGDNIGAAASFFTLLSDSSGADFFAFCDQDDIWNKDKIERAVIMLDSVTDGVPTMYFSAVEVVDAEDNFIKVLSPKRKIGFGNALVENVAIGCSVVLNKLARALIVRELPSQCLMHDSWCYLVMSCLGLVVYDDYPSMRYRQHSNNVFGAPTSSMDSLIRKVKRFSFRKKGVFRFSDQVTIFMKIYGNIIPENNKEVIGLYARAEHSFFGRLQLLLSPAVWRQKRFDNLILKLLVLLNCY